MELITEIIKDQGLVFLLSLAVGLIILKLVKATGKWYNIVFWSILSGHVLLLFGAALHS